MLDLVSNDRKIRGGITALVKNLGTRNGLFYAPAYVAIGMYSVEKNGGGEKPGKMLVGFALSMAALMLESVVFVLILDTKETILWMSVFPASYFLFQFVYGIQIGLPDRATRFIRKLSTMLYVSHGLFLIAFQKLEYGVPLFLVVTFFSAAFGTTVIYLSDKFKFLKYIY